MMRLNKLERLSSETLSSRVLEFEGKAGPTQLEHLSDTSFLVFLENVRPDRKVSASYKHSSLFGLVVSGKGKKFCNINTWASMS